MKTVKRIFIVLFIFILGVFVGAAGANADLIKKLRRGILGGPEAVMEVIVQRLDHELHLDAEQKRKLQSITDEARIKLRQSRARIQPEVEATLLEAENRTRDMLYPNQVERFDEMVRKGREQWKAKEAPKVEMATPAKTE